MEFYLVFNLFLKINFNLDCVKQLINVSYKSQILICFCFCIYSEKKCFEERGVLYVENYFVEKIFFKDHFVKLCVCVFVCVCVCGGWMCVLVCVVWKMNVEVMLELGTKAKANGLLMILNFWSSFSFSKFSRRSNFRRSE